jgi:hypothetical protein
MRRPMRDPAQHVAGLRRRSIHILVDANRAAGAASAPEGPKARPPARGHPERQLTHRKHAPGAQARGFSTLLKAPFEERRDFLHIATLAAHAPERYVGREGIEQWLRLPDQVESASGFESAKCSGYEDESRCHEGRRSEKASTE